MERAFNIHVSPRFCVLTATMLFFAPLLWVIAWLAAVVIHEAFHCIALRLCGKKIYQIRVGIDGARIIAEDLNRGETIFCTLAGPFGGLMLLFAAEIFPHLAVCGLLQSVYNLLPIFPFDGGRAFLAAMQLLFREELAAKLCAGAEILTCFFLLVTGAFCIWIWDLGLIPFILAAIWVIKVMK